MTFYQLLLLIGLTSLGSALGSFLGVFLALNSKQEVVQEAKNIFEKIKNSTFVEKGKNVLSPIAKQKVKMLLSEMKDEI